MPQSAEDINPYLPPQVDDLLVARRRDPTARSAGEWLLLATRTYIALTCGVALSGGAYGAAIGFVMDMSDGGLDDEVLSATAGIGVLGLLFAGVVALFASLVATGVIFLSPLRDSGYKGFAIVGGLSGALTGLLAGAPLGALALGAAVVGCAAGAASAAYSRPRPRPGVPPKALL